MIRVITLLAICALMFLSAVAMMASTINVDPTEVIETTRGSPPAQNEIVLNQSQPLDDIIAPADTSAYSDAKAALPPQSNFDTGKRLTALTSSNNFRSLTGPDTFVSSTRGMTKRTKGPHL